MNLLLQQDSRGVCWKKNLYYSLDVYTTPNSSIIISFEKIHVPLTKYLINKAQGLSNPNHRDLLKGP